MLTYLSTEVHAAFKPLFRDASEAEHANAREAVGVRLGFLESRIVDLYLFGPRFTVADAYLFVMLRWAKGFGMPLSPRLLGYSERILERETVRQALTEEALAVTEEALA